VIDYFKGYSSLGDDRFFVSPWMMTLPPPLEKLLRTPMTTLTFQQALRYGQARLRLDITSW